MRFNNFSRVLKHKNPSVSPIYDSPFFRAQTVTQTVTLSQNLDDDDRLCSGTAQSPPEKYEDQQSSYFGSPGPCPIPNGYLSGESRIERAWVHWKKLGEPKLIVAPMVDNSELPFRLLCRKYGAEAAYTPMLHSRIFTENEKYRSQEFTTCKILCWKQLKEWHLIVIMWTLILGNQCWISLLSLTLVMKS